MYFYLCMIKIYLFIIFSFINYSSLYYIYHKRILICNQIIYFFLMYLDFRFWSYLDQVEERIFIHLIWYLKIFVREEVDKCPINSIKCWISKIGHVLWKLKTGGKYGSILASFSINPMFIGSRSESLFKSSSEAQFC